MAGKDNLEEEVKAMKRHFGGVVSLVKDLKVRLEKLEKRTEDASNKEIKAILEKQTILEGTALTLLILKKKRNFPER